MAEGGARADKHQFVLRTCESNVEPAPVQQQPTNLGGRRRKRRRRRRRMRRRRRRGEGEGERERWRGGGGGGGGGATPLS